MLFMVAARTCRRRAPQGLAIAGRGSQGIYTGVALATAALALIPVIVIYLALQRHIIRGFTLTGMKG